MLDKYKIIYKTDTFSIQLTESEKQESILDRYLELSKVGKKKTKKIRESTSGKLKLLLNDTLYSFYFVDYYESYAIAFLSTERRVSKKNMELNPLGFRRIKYDSIGFMETDGQRRIMPKLAASTVGMAAGSGVFIQSLKGSISPYFSIIGLGATIASVKLFDSVVTKEYFINSPITKKIFEDLNSRYHHKFKSWSIEVKTKGRKKRTN